MSILVVNSQMRNPDRPSLKKICACGSGKLYKVREVVSHICRIMGVDTKIKYQYPVRLYDGLQWRADVSKIELLNYKQNYTLAEGLYETILSFENAN